MLNWLKHNHQALTGLGAMLVGIAALFVAWDQARVMRAQQHGSVVPVLQVDGFIQSTSEQRSLGLRIVNNGVGPAMIQSVRLQRDGQPMSDFAALLDYLPEGYDRSWSSVNGRVLAPDGEVLPAVFNWQRGILDDAELSTLLGEWSYWAVEACYCSVFERCWTTTSDNEMRQPVRECPSDDEDVFERFGNPEPADRASEETG